jgi:hypothetical protein
MPRRFLIDHDEGNETGERIENGSENQYRTSTDIVWGGEGSLLTMVTKRKISPGKCSLNQRLVIVDALVGGSVFLFRYHGFTHITIISFPPFLFLPRSMDDRYSYFSSDASSFNRDLSEQYNRSHFLISVSSWHDPFPNKEERPKESQVLVDEK